MTALTRAEARRVLLATVGPRRLGDDQAALLASLRHVQIDPIDRIGTNHDLVAFARTPLTRAGVFAGPAFEHHAKEWCLLPPEAFPYYREAAAHTPTWRHTGRMRSLDARLLDRVQAEVERKGPCTPADLEDHGRLPGVDFKGWGGPGKVGTVALKALALRCRLVVIGRRRGSRVYAAPGQVYPELFEAPAPGPFARWAVQERVRAAGMLSLGAGPWWGMLPDARKDGTVADLVAEGRLVEVGLEGSRRRFLVRPESLDAQPVLDDLLRILGPLDPLIWNRELVEHAFGFRYLWEVYKPAEKREFGYYVVPLLHRGRFVGRLEARATGGVLDVSQVWREVDDFPGDALTVALDDLAGRLGCTEVRWSC